MSQLMTAAELARAKVLTEAASVASDMADEYRALATSKIGPEREHLLSKAAGAVAVMVQLIKLAQ